MTKRTSLIVVAPSMLLAAAILLGLSGCATITDAINTMNDQIQSGVSQSTSTDSSSSSSSSSSSANISPSIALSPQLNFYLMYSLTGILQAYGQGAKYKQGQGTVWESKASNSGSTTTFEHALLKNNPGGTQWWRIKVDSDGKSYLYEYLAKMDGTIEKVRYKDPSTGQIEEFVPDKSKEQQQSQSTPSAEAAAKDNGDNVKVTKDKQTITVGAGTFQTEHTTYLDTTKNYRQEIWTSNKVPGSMVKFLNDDMSSNDTNQAELIKIESGITTVLGSY